MCQGKKKGGRGRAQVITVGGSEPREFLGWDDKGKGLRSTNYLGGYANIEIPEGRERKVERHTEEKEKEEKTTK